MLLLHSSSLRTNEQKCFSHGVTSLSKRDSWLSVAHRLKSPNSVRSCCFYHCSPMHTLASSPPRPAPPLRSAQPISTALLPHPDAKLCPHSPTSFRKPFRGLHWDLSSFRLQLHLGFVLHGTHLHLVSGPLQAPRGSGVHAFGAPASSPKTELSFCACGDSPPGRFGVWQCPGRPPLLLRHLLCISLSQASAGAGD